MFRRMHGAPGRPAGEPADGGPGRPPARVVPFDYDAAWGLWDDMKRYGPMSRHTRRLVWRLIAPLPFTSVLDVGCGQGALLQEIARRRPHVALAGVDLSTQAVVLAQQRLPQARFCVLDISRGRLRHAFDLVLCTDVLEHIADDQAALRNLRAMCRRWLVVGTLQGRMRRFERAWKLPALPCAGSSTGAFRSTPRSTATCWSMSRLPRRWAGSGSASASWRPRSTPCSS
jgi:SAM-dependent methyltransferase